MPTYNGRVVDSQTGAGIPGATVTVFKDGTPWVPTVSNNTGYFSINTNTPADKIYFSSVGYKAWNFPASEYQHLFELERDIRDIDPVVLPPYPVAKKNKFLLPVLGLIALLLLSKKK